ncbi:MAG: type II toxin-antitoxin system VapC family toxin [Alphaproteobacteria bacterium]
MILLDTNVVSELMRRVPSKVVESWFDGQEPTQLFVSSISIAEILFGLRTMPEGRKRDAMNARFEGFLRSAFQHSILDFDGSAARAYADIRGARQEMGRPMRNFDAQIAAVARANRLAVATRSIRDFEDVGLELINPFDNSV